MDEDNIRIVMTEVMQMLEVNLEVMADHLWKYLHSCVMLKVEQMKNNILKC